MNKKNSMDVYDGADRFDEFVGSALSVTKLSDDDVFARELGENSLFRASAYWTWAIAIAVPLLLSFFDGRSQSIKLWSFEGATQLAIAAPFIFFCAIILVTWYIAYRNHIQRIACIKRVPNLRRYTVVSIACGCAAATTILIAEVDRFDFYWSISLLMLTIGYFFAWQVAKIFQDTVLKLRNGSLNTPSPTYHYKLEAEKKLQGKSFPLGEAYKGVDDEKLDEYYDRRVRELSFMISISDGWKVSNRILSISLLVIFALSAILCLGTDIRREYFEVALTDRGGQQVLLAQYNNVLPYLFEISWMVYLVLFGIFAAGLRSRINPTVYGDEAVLCNTTEPLEWNAAPAQPAAASQNLSMNNSEPTHQTKILLLMQTARILPAICSGLLLFLVSGDVIYSVAFSLFLAFSFLINDLFDYLYGKDILCHPDRALPSGKLTVSSVTRSAGMTFGLFVVILTLLPLSQVYALVVGLMLSVLYSLFIKRKTPLPGTIVWAVCITITFMAGLAHTATAKEYLLFALIFFAREILLDVRDMDADRQFAATASLSHILGYKGAIRFSSVLFALSAFGVALIIENSELYVAFLFCISSILMFMSYGARWRIVEKLSLFSYLGVLFLTN